VNDLVKTKAVAAALGVSAETVRKRGEKERWLCKRTPGGVLWLRSGLPDGAKAALARADAKGALSEEADPPARQAGLFARASSRGKESALLRAELVRLWKGSGLRKEDFLAEYNAGGAALFNRLGPVSKTTFYRWLADLKRAGGDIGALAPQYGLAKKGPGATLSEVEKRLLMRFWLKDSQPSMADAFGLLKQNVPESA
jgi:transposase